jgi:hypothetical protein
MSSAGCEEKQLVNIFVFATFHLYGQFYRIRIQNYSISENIDVLQQLSSKSLSYVSIIETCRLRVNINEVLWLYEFIHVDSVQSAPESDFQAYECPSAIW